MEEAGVKVALVGFATFALFILQKRKSKHDSIGLLRKEGENLLDPIGAPNNTVKESIAKFMAWAAQKKEVRKASKGWLINKEMNISFN